mmetsp:Transcript_27211/g.60237  ORF Transcript_27211/g.60237 Transcript_27211/m.60237 type:complete len:202 (-) Transcript_27211:308-913(-)
MTYSNSAPVLERTLKEPSRKPFLRPDSAVLSSRKTERLEASLCATVDSSSITPEKEGVTSINPSWKILRVHNTCSWKSAELSQDHPSTFSSTSVARHTCIALKGLLRNRFWEMPLSRADPRCTDPRFLTAAPRYGSWSPGSKRGGGFSALKLSLSTYVYSITPCSMSFASPPSSCSRPRCLLASICAAVPDLPDRPFLDFT